MSETAAPSSQQEAADLVARAARAARAAQRSVAGARRQLEIGRASCRERV